VLHARAQGPHRVSPPVSLAPARSAVARNYAPLPVTAASAEGCWVEDADGVRRLDLLAGYSALNFGHRHPRLVAAAHRQLDRVTLTSRAFGADQLEPFCRDLARLCGKEAVLPMNTGAEAVETAIKAARRWGYEVKGVARDRARIVVFDGNFHGRTTTIVGFSDDPDARSGYGPFAPGFVSVPFGDLAAVEAAIDADTVAVLVEPIQGEAGVIVPPDGFLAALRDVCTARDVLLIADEIQSGLGRTGTTFACDHEGVVPDVYVLGKALGGGIVPLSAIVADWDVMSVFTPGSHGSTFGGNPLACAVGREVVAILDDGRIQARAATLGAEMHEHLAGIAEALPRGAITAVRGRGLWAGVDLGAHLPPARVICEELLAHRLLVKDTHGHTLRIAPPLVVDRSDLHWALDRIAKVVASRAA
jgi:ornithine--oxo-acid transaminase